MTRGTVVIAAHNEELVISRTLAALASVVSSGEVRVVVACNGCTDGTAELARTHPGVEVVESAVASKTAALRVADQLIGAGHRIYLDADIVLTSQAARDVFTAFDRSVIAGRPPHRFDTDNASWIVRHWYQTRADLPSISSALWGAGCYGLSHAGRSRFGEFPEIVSDDLFVDSQFRRDEITIVSTDPVVVTTPRRLSDLVRILRRSYRTQDEVAGSGGGISDGQRGQLGDLRTLVRRSPSRVPDALLYGAVILYSRLIARISPGRARWERDLSSRQLS